MINFDIDIQRQVITLGLDDSSPNGMLPNMRGGQYGFPPLEWRNSVILLTCGMLSAGLISPIPGIENYHAKDSDEIRNLLERGDPINGFDIDLVWDVIHFFGTETLVELLRKLKLNEWTAMGADLSLSLGRALGTR